MSGLLQLIGYPDMIAIMSSPLHEFFAALPSRSQQYAAGQFLYHRDDSIEAIFWIERGIVHLQRCSSDGTAAVMQRAIAGSLLAEASVFSHHYHCDAVAVDAVNAKRIAMSDVHRAMCENPEFTAALAAHLAQEVMRLRSRSEIMALKTVTARLDAWLAFHDNQLPPRGKRVEFAREIGVSPEALYRELARRRVKDVP